MGLWVSLIGQLGFHHGLAYFAISRTLVRSDQKGLEAWPGSVRIYVRAKALPQAWGMCLGLGAGSRCSLAHDRCSPCGCWRNERMSHCFPPNI